MEKSLPPSILPSPHPFHFLFAVACSLFLLHEPFGQSHFDEATSLAQDKGGRGRTGGERRLRGEEERNKEGKGDGEG